MLDSRLVILQQALVDAERNNEFIDEVLLEYEYKLSREEITYARFFYSLFRNRESTKPILERFNAIEREYLNYLIEQENYPRFDAVDLLSRFSLRDIISKQSQKEMEDAILEIMILSARNKRIKKSRDQHPDNDLSI